MRRTIAILLLLTAVLLLAACQAGSAATQAEPTATPTTPPATATPEPAPPSDDHAQPPPASLTIGGQEQEAALGTYCWDRMCVDMIGIPTPAAPLVVGSPVNGTVTLNFSQAPTELGLYVFPASPDIELDEDANGYRWWQPSESENHPLEPALESEFSLELEPGLYVFNVFAMLENQGDASYGFLVEVQ